jgi:hypothetical protein
MWSDRSVFCPTLDHLTWHVNNPVWLKWARIRCARMRIYSSASRLRGIASFVIPIKPGWLVFASSIIKLKNVEFQNQTNNRPRHFAPLWSIYNLYSTMCTIWESYWAIVIKFCPYYSCLAASCLYRGLACDATHLHARRKTGPAIMVTFSSIPLLTQTITPHWSPF